MVQGTAIPVLMYHSVGHAIDGWKSPSFTLPARVFDDQLRHLRRAGYRSATLDDIRAHIAGDTALPANSVSLTFDDGYLDNWIYVAPLLERHGFTGTVFVSPEFVDPRDGVRPALGDLGPDALNRPLADARGFMSWSELRKVMETGVLSVQCHALTHTWYPTGPKIVDFHHPGDGYHWLDWNAHPEDKPLYLDRIRDEGPAWSRVPWGTPVYEHGKSLESTRYFPDANEASRLCAFVNHRHGDAFFAQSDWREILFKEVERMRKQTPAAGAYESPDGRRQRYELELVESRRIIKDRLGSEPKYFIFPGGGYNEESFDVARSIFAGVAVRAPESDTIRNQPGGDPGKLSRLGTQFIQSGDRGGYSGGAYLVDFLREYQGSGFARRRRQIRKLLYVIGIRIGLWP